MLVNGLTITNSNPQFPVFNNRNGDITVNNLVMESNIIDSVRATTIGSIVKKSRQPFSPQYHSLRFHYRISSTINKVQFVSMELKSRKIPSMP